MVRPGGNGGLRGPGRALAAASPVADRESGPRGERSGVLQGATRGNQARRRARPPAARGGGERPRRGRAPPDRRSVRPLRGAAAGAAHSSRGGGADRRRAAGDRLSALCAPRPTHAARRAVGEPQGRAADEWRDRGGGGGGRGAAHRQARRRQRLGGDRAGLHAPRALCRRGPRLCRGAAPSRRRPLAARRLRRGSGRRRRRRGHRRSAPGVRSGAGRSAGPAAGALSISRSPPSRTARRRTRSGTTKRCSPTRRPMRLGGAW